MLEKELRCQGMNRVPGYSSGSKSVSISTGQVRTRLYSEGSIQSEGTKHLAQNQEFLDSGRDPPERSFFDSGSIWGDATEYLQGAAGSSIAAPCPYLQLVQEFNSQRCMLMILKRN